MEMSIFAKCMLTALILLLLNCMVGGVSIDLQLKMLVTQGILFLMYMIYMTIVVKDSPYGRTKFVLECVMHVQVILILLHAFVGLVRMWMI